MPIAPPGYALGALLGRGGFGVVWAAEREHDQLPVAIKVVSGAGGSAAGLLRFERELEALRTIGPPAVPRVYADGTLPGGVRYLVMERLVMPTLADGLAAEREPMPPDRFMRAAGAILDAVERAHACRFVHRDLKPENIFLDLAIPQAKLIDFGIVKALSKGRSSPELTSPTAVLGTTEYMAPEQCRGGQIDVRTDIYALGSIFFEMLTGRPPFLGLASDIILAHCDCRPPRLSSFVPVPQAIEEVVLQCLAKQPQRRFATVAELRDALRASDRRAEGPVTQRTATPLPQVGRKQWSVGLLFFQSSRDATAVADLLRDCAGQLAHCARSSYVGLFSHETGDNPVKRAVLAAKALLSSGLAERALVDLATVRMRTLPDGSRQFLSSAFGDPASYPAAADPVGIQITEAAVQLLDDVVSTPHPSRGNTRLVSDSQVAAEQSLEPLIGREGTLQALATSLTSALDRRVPTLVRVIGDTGTGKTHLLRHLERLVTDWHPGAECLSLRSHPPASGDPDQTLRELLQHVLDASPDPLGKDPHTRMATALGGNVTDEISIPAALLLGWIAPDAPEVRALAAAPGALRAGAARAAGAGLRRRCAQHPLVVLLDDAHLADDATLDALEYAALAETGLPICVIALARPTFETLRPEWSSRAAARYAERLGPLQGEAAAQLCRRLLRPVEDVPAQAVDHLVSRAGGNPLLLRELCRALRSQGLIRQQDNGRTWYLATEALDALPQLTLVEWLASRELEALPPPLASHAQLVSSLGDESTVEEAAGVLAELERRGAGGGFPLDAGVATSRLLSSGVLVTHADGRLTFRHALFSEAIYQSMPVALRQAIHGAAYRFHCTHHLLGERDRRVRLALHAARAGLRQEAAGRYLELARLAESRHAYLDAEFTYTRALEQLATTHRVPADAVAAYRGRGLMRYRIGRYADAVQDFERARVGAQQAGDVLTEVDILLDHATALDWMEEFRRSHELVEEAAQLWAREPSPTAEARVLMGRGRSCHRMNQDDQAAEILTRAAARAEALGDDGYETLAISLILVGYILARLGRPAQAEQAFDRVVPLCEAHGDKLHLGAALGNRLMLWIASGDMDRLLEDLKRLLEISRELGNARLEQHAHLVYALSHHWLGELELAKLHARRTVEIDEHRFGAEARPESAIVLARVLAAGGDTEQARTVLNGVRERQARARASGEREIEILPAEQVLFAMVDLHITDGGPAAWRELEARAAGVLRGQELIEFYDMWARTAARTDDVLTARQAMTRALEIAGRMPNVMRERLQRTLAVIP
jgi:tetratricopeptide (TPR) repeat protein